MEKTLKAECKLPPYERVMEDCKNKVLEKFTKYGNSWVDAWFLDDRLKEEIKEYFEIKDGFDWEQKISELEDVINICCMMIHNFHNARNKEIVGARLGI